MMKFIPVAILSVIVVGAVSLLWPRITSRPRPAPLEKVHEMVLGTQVGQQAAETLGVASPSGITPINPSQVVQSVVQTVVTTIEKRTEQVVVENAVKQLSNQFDTLPPDQKQQIQQVICKPQ